MMREKLKKLKEKLKHYSAYSEEDILLVRNYDATGDELHVDVPLSNLVTNYIPDGFIAPRVFPTIDVPKKSDMIPEIPLGEFARLLDAKRSPGTEAKKVMFEITTKTYYCENYALKAPLTIEDRTNSDAVWNLRTNQSIFIRTLLAIGYENRTQSRVVNGVNSTYNPASAWSAVTSGPRIFNDIETLLNDTEDTTGRRPNQLIFGSTAWREIRKNNWYNDKLFPHGGGIMSQAQLAALHGVDEVLVPTPYYNTTAEGLGSANLATIWNKDDVYALFSPEINGNAIPPTSIFGVTISWRMAGGIAPNWIVRALPFDQKTLADEVEISTYQDEKVIDGSLGVAYRGVNSAQ